MSLLCGNGEDFGTHFFGATHFGVSDFLGVVGRFTPPSKFGGGSGLGGGRGLAVKLSLVGLWDFGRECLRVCLEVLENYDSRAEEPSIQFQGTTILRV